MEVKVQQGSSRSDQADREVDSKWKAQEILDKVESSNRAEKSHPLPGETKGITSLLAKDEGYRSNTFQSKTSDEEKPSEGG